MNDSSGVRLRALADELDAAVLAVPGVLRIQPRLDVARLARRVADGFAAVRQGVHAPGSRVEVTVGPEATVVSLDVAIARDHSGPVVARAVAETVLLRLAGEGLPEPRVDVRIVAVG